MIYFSCLNPTHVSDQLCTVLKNRTVIIKQNRFLPLLFPCSVALLLVNVTYYSDNPNYASEPPSLIEGTYVCFGGNYTTEDVLLSLEEQGVPQLYPKDSNIDYKKELRSLNRELQLHILELADVLVERPSQYAKRIGEISSIFKNLHHLLNSLRPHQARATLIHIMELQIKQRKQSVEDIKRRREEAQRLLTDAFVTFDGQ